MPHEELLNSFATYIIGRPSSPNTAREYVKDVKHIYTTVGDPTSESISEYFARPVGLARKIRVASAWRTWVEFCTRRGIEVPTTDFAPRRIPKKIRESLEEEQYQSVLRAAEQMGRRGEIVLLLMLTGMRENEARKAKVSDVVTINSNRYLKADSKGGDERLVPVRGKLETLIEVLIKGKSSKDFLLLDSFNRPVKRNRIVSAVKAAGKIAGVDHLHPHRLRSGFSDWLRRKGVDIRTIQSILGHASLETTMKYTRVTSTDLEGVGEKMEL